MTGCEVRTTHVTVDKAGVVEVTSGRQLNLKQMCCLNPTCCTNGIPHTHALAGIKNFKVLKTTQSGYEGFLHDKYTLLPDSHDRILATAITCTWK